MGKSSGSYLEDRNLSWRAKGLLAFLLTLPSDFEVTTQWLIGQATDGEWATRSCLNELTKHRYMVRLQLMGDKGKFGKYIILFAKDVDSLLDLYEKKLEEIGGLSFVKIIT